MMSPTHPDRPGLLHNHTFDELAVGQSVAVERTLLDRDLEILAAVAGGADLPRVGSDAVFAPRSDSGIAGQGLWAGALITSLIATRLPGPGTVLRRQNLAYHAPLRIGDRLVVSIAVRTLEHEKRKVLLACSVSNQRGERVVDGEVQVTAPAERIEWTRAQLPPLGTCADDHDGLPRWLGHVAGLEAIRVGVVHPCDAVSLASALEAQRAGLIVPLLIAPRGKLEALAASLGLDLGGIAIVDVPHSHAAAARGVELARDGRIEALMKGSLHTDELMTAVVASTAGLRTKRRISHCFVLQTPHYPRPFIVTDAAINLAPDLEQKADIIRNAIDLAHVIGVETPKVAILAAAETVHPSMPATLDAAALCKMADRGQISGGVLDGPLAFDNAVSPAAAHTKGIVSPVAGAADILVVPDLESGNMLAKQLVFMGDATSAGIVLGAKVPVVLTSRADARESRIASCALALMLAHHYRERPP